MDEEKIKRPVTRMILILLTIFIVGPLVFVGSCIPVGFVGVILVDFAETNPYLKNMFDNQSLSMIFVFSIFLIIFLITYYIIKKRIEQINKKYN
ncbi:MAG: hypothetical protein WC867_03355 [Candidatus Pacearchaeota archaeon]|jgi:uncharacterized BrkB/YihY/UPF0761 family membrane protein